MIPKLNIVASCTARKAVAASAEFRLRTITGSPAPARARAWQERLERSDVRTPAASLYKGAHWKAILDLSVAAARSGAAARLWIASAGLGLISGEEQVVAYSATFVPNDPDSVSAGFAGDWKSYARDWWRTLGDLSRSRGRHPCTIAELARYEPRAAMLVVASPRYLHAMRDDLAAAARVLANPSALVIVTSKADADLQVLADWTVVTSARLQTWAGGGCGSQNARFALRFAEQFGSVPWKAEQFRKELNHLSPSSPRAPRKSATDVAVVNFISRQLATEPRTSWTRALRLLRDAGLACEQSRFRELFTGVALTRK